MDAGSIWQAIIQYGALAVLVLVSAGFIRGDILPGYLWRQYKVEVKEQLDKTDKAREAERAAWKAEADGWRDLYLETKRVAGQAVDMVSTNRQGQGR